MDQVVAITTDNGSNLAVAFSGVDSEWLNCFGHNLNLVISKALQIHSVLQCIKKCCSLVEVFSCSWKRPAIYGISKSS